MTYGDIIRFHGHECPGLAIGYRMARAGMKALDEIRSEDEEVVAIVENDACGVDALQCLSGCTFGKGNLIFRDYGKQVYTLYSRQSGRGVRIVFHGRGLPESARGDRAAKARYILEAPQREILSVVEVSVDEPEKARAHESLTCDECGEEVMDTRVRRVGRRQLCIPCAEGASPAAKTSSERTP